MTPSTCSANFWRWGYERPPLVASEASSDEKPLSNRQKKRNANRQKELQRCTGFAGEWYELAHTLVDELRKLSRFTDSALWFAGQLVAHGGIWNFEGNRKLSELSGWSERTMQRDRKALEDAGLIKTYRLEPGDRVPGMKRRVRRHTVVRNCSGLLALVSRKRFTPRRGKKARAATAADRRTTPSKDFGVAVRVPSTPPVETVQACLQKGPEWLTDVFVGMLASMQPTPAPAPQRPHVEPRKPACVDPTEVDEWEDETERLEREPRQRPPPS